MNFTEKLKLYRIRAGLSQRELCGLMGASRQTVIKWESGYYYPKPQKIAILCRVLDVCPNDLLLSDTYNEDSKYKEELPVHPSAEATGKNIARLRRVSRISANDLCTQTKVTKQTAARWEDGGALPETANIVAIARIFDVGIADILK